MQQLVKNPKSRALAVLEVPFPALNPGHVLVRNHYSVISSGADGHSTNGEKRGYLGKDGSRKNELSHVIESIKIKGFNASHERERHQLDAPSALGYSCAGEVIATGPGVTRFAIGDRVACAGDTAVHAEVISAPVNLCVSIPYDVDLKHAAFTTLGAIAMQGVRRAELGLGSNCVVVGLNLVGLITLQLLEAAGVQVIGIDTDIDRIVLARRLGFGKIVHREDPLLDEIVSKISRGEGTDAVIITAGTSSHDPVNLAGQLCRKKGRVVIVGSVPAGFNRATYYKKELDLMMAGTYGPGRYDKMYEQKGLDYPISHVRWTENRNMQAFVDLLSRKKLDIESLITHTFPLESSREAYQMILQRTTSYTGIVLEYDISRRLSKRVALKYQYRSEKEVNVGLIGAGEFAQSVLLPALKGKATLIGLASGQPNNTRYAAEKFGFDYCTGEFEEVLEDERINTIFIATRHGLHAPLVLKAIEKGKHVFVEKPLCLTQEDLNVIRSSCNNHANVHLMVGFNRRFAPHIKKLKSTLQPQIPLAINYRINAGLLPPEHWLNDAEQGGGRIVGEVCHFIDLACYLVGAVPSSLAAHALTDISGLNDTVTINMAFVNGSTASISYFSNGNKKLEKERLEVFYGGQVAIIEDFKSMSMYGGRYERTRLKRPDRGHEGQIDRFLYSIKNGTSAPISMNEIYHSMQTTFKVEESIINHRMISL